MWQFDRFASLSNIKSYSYFHKFIFYQLVKLTSDFSLKNEKQETQIQIVDDSN